MNSVQQGGTFSFNAGFSGDDVSGLTVNIAVKQYPGDTAAIERAIAYSNGSFPGTLTSVETAALAVGQWFIHIQATDSDEDIRAPIKLYVSKGWV